MKIRNTKRKTQKHIVKRNFLFIIKNKNNYKRINKIKSKKNTIFRFRYIFMLLFLSLICIFLYFILIKHKSKNRTQTNIFNNDKINNISYINNINNDYLKLKVCVCTLGKKENRYIKEWVEHYKKYGVDKIFLYDNNDLDGEKFEDVIKNDIDKGFVEIFNWRGKLKPIMSIMNECYRNNYDKYDWIIFYEIDEFINLHNYTNVKHFLNEEKFKNCKLIYLNLVLHTDNNQLHYENKPLLERFPEIVPPSKAYFEVKSILRGHIPNIYINCIHTINKQYTNCDGYGHQKKIRLIYASDPDYTNYYIDHFYCKSTEEFIEKINRGDPLFNTNSYKMERIEKLSKQIILTKEKIEMIEKGTGLSLSKYKKL